jgi:hypothetical protein
MRGFIMPKKIKDTEQGKSVQTSSVDVTGLLEQNAKLMEQLQVINEKNAQLMAALQDARISHAVVESEDNMVEVINVAGASVSFSVTDSRGNAKDVFLPAYNSKYKLYPEQVDELRERDSSIFEGDAPLLAVVGMEEANPNVIINFKKFCKDLDVDDIAERITAIESVPLLFNLYHYIESLRFVSEDAQGNPLFTEENGVKVPHLKEVQLEPKMVMIETAVIRRAQELSGIRLSMDGGE